MTHPAVNISPELLNEPQPDSLLLGPGPDSAMTFSIWSYLSGLKNLEAVLNGAAIDGVGLIFTGLKREGFLGESAAIIIAVAAGIAGGMLSSVGKELWDLIKKGVLHLFRKNKSLENIVEVSIELQQYDVVIRVESISEDRLDRVLDDVPRLIQEIQHLANTNAKEIQEAQTLQLSIDDSTGICTLDRHSYRRVPLLVRKHKVEQSSDNGATKISWKSKFHTKECRFYRKESAMAIHQARELGMEPCKICKPW
jgi:hypothetical protein